jgi:hypothetical protein
MEKWPLRSDLTAKVQGEFVAEILLGATARLC